MIKIVLAVSIAYSSLAVAETAPPVSATISYTLPTAGPLPKTYRVTLAITAPENPDWIVSAFVAGAARTVTAENQGRFTETWDGLDENFMPVPPGEYGVKGIYMPSEIWAPDGKPHTLRAKYLSCPNALMPKPGRREQGPFITGDQCVDGMGDIAVGPDGVAVFYWRYLENAENAYRVDLNLPLGPEQLLGGFGSGGTAGGDYATTDGETIWCASQFDKIVHLDSTEGLYIFPPFLYRADRKPFGGNRDRANGSLTAGLVTGLAAWRPKTQSPALVFVAERGKMVVVDKKREGLTRYGWDLWAESPTERVNLLRVLNGDTAAELSRLPVAEPTALVVANDRLYLMEKRDGGWTVRHAAVPADGKLDAVAWSAAIPLAGLRDPRDLAVDSRGCYYVADPALNQVLRFTADGKFERKLGRLERQPEGGYDPNSFMEPIRVVCWRDKAGAERLLVAESGGPSRVTEWTTDGKLLRDWGYGLSGNGGFAVDPESPEHIYLIGANHTFLRYRVDYGGALPQPQDAPPPSPQPSPTGRGTGQTHCDRGAWTLEKVWHDVDITGLTYPEIINHAGHKYLSFKRLGQGVNIWRFAGDRLLPSAGIIREGAPDAKGSYFTWHDANGNGKIDGDERRPLAMPRHLWLNNRTLLDRYFGDYRQGDLSLLVPMQASADLYRLPVKELDTHGNPVHGEWEKVLTDGVYAAKAAGTATALYGGNEASSAFNGDWGSARQLPAVSRRPFWIFGPKVESPGDIVINMRGGSFSANEGAEQKLSRYVPDGQGGFKMKWRVGRSSNIVPGRGEVVGSIQVTQPMLGLIGMIDQSRAGVHIYDWASGLYVDTLMQPADLQYRSVYGSPGEFFGGAAHEADGKVYLRWGKTMPTLFEVEGWTKDFRPRPVTGLPATVAIRAEQIATPPELALQVRGGAGAAKVALFQPMPGGGPALDGSPAGWEGCAPIRFGDDRATVEVRAGYDPQTLYLRWEVKTERPASAPPLPSPERMFTHDRGADTLSFYLQGDSAAKGKASGGRPGDIRIVFSLYDDNGKIRPAALGLYPTWDGAPDKARPFLYITPGQRAPFAHAALLDTVKLGYVLSADCKTLVLAAAIPRSVLPGKVPALDGGWKTMANFEATIGGAHKQWWSNADGSASREVNDEPTEAGLYPGSWGQTLFAPLGQSLPVQAWLVNGSWRAKELKYTGHPDNKRQFQQFFDGAVFPPDSRKIAAAEIATDKAPQPGQWRLLTARPTDATSWSHDAAITETVHLIYPDNGSSLYVNDSTLHYAAAWIWAPAATEVTLEFPQQPQNNVSAWLGDAPLAETKREGVYHTVNSPQKVALKPGWNQLFLRAYALGYDLRFGAVVTADPEILWRLRLSVTPPEEGK
jgi:hypothetical protein